MSKNDAEVPRRGESEAAATRQRRLLAIHGLGQDEHAWDRCALRDLVAVVLPGHGDREGAATSIADMADEIAVSTAGVFDVVGVALGALVAQQLVIRHPERVRSLVLASTAAVIRETGALERQVATVLYGGVEGIVEESLQRWFTSRALVENRWGVRYTRRRLSAMTSEDYANAVRAMARYDARGALPQVRCPVTLVVGRCDRRSVASAGEMLALIRDIRLRPMPGRHMVHLEEPALFTEIVEEHLVWAQR